MDGKFVPGGIPINELDEPKVKNVTASDGSVMTSNDPVVDSVDSDACFSTSPVVGMTSHNCTIGHADTWASLATCADPYHPGLFPSEASYVSPYIALDPDLNVTYFENQSRFHSYDATSDFLGARASMSQWNDEVWTPEVAAFFANLGFSE